MYQYISNKLVFTRTRALGSLLLFLILMYILIYSENCYSAAPESPNITANHEAWRHLVEIRATAAATAS